MVLTQEKIQIHSPIKLSLDTYNRYDPTRTTSLRNAYARDMNKRFDELIGVIKKAIVDQDCFGLQKSPMMHQMTPPTWRSFDFPNNPEKVAAFMKWLQDQIDRGMLSITEFEQIGQSINSHWMNKYLNDSYKRGLIRAREELRKAGYNVPSIEDTGGIAMSMSTPFHIDRLGLVYIRAYNELKGITTMMDTQISRILAQGLADGDGPRLLARKIVSTVNGNNADKLGVTDTLGRFIPAKRRAELIARTETIRAHHLSMVQEYRNWALEGVIVQAEIATARDSRVCSRCESLEGRLFTLDEVQNLIPVHPSCRCCILPITNRIK